jgi:hypothetical protein
VSEYSKFYAWDRRCSDRGSFGMTAGDSMHLGLRDYNQPYPCPNGLPLDMRLPGECEHWRKRVEKAKRDIDLFDREKKLASVVWTDADVTELAEIGAMIDEH